jgi:hypothetical protein
MTGIPENQDWDAYPPGTAPQPQPAAQYALAPAYGPPPGYGPPPVYGPAPYGPPPGFGWYALPPRSWPDGPGRPSIATAAAVLGFVTAGLTILVSGLLLIGVFNGDDDLPSLVLALGLPCAAGLIVGGVRLQDRRSPTTLFLSAVGCVAVLLLAWLAGAATIDRTNGLEGLTVFVVGALVLPILTACFAWQRVVRGWAAARPE